MKDNLELKADECLWRVLSNDKDMELKFEYESCKTCDGYLVGCKNFISYKSLSKKFKEE